VETTFSLLLCSGNSLQKMPAEPQAAGLNISSAKGANCALFGTACNWPNNWFSYDICVVTALGDKVKDRKSCCKRITNCSSGTFLWRATTCWTVWFGFVAAAAALLEVAVVVAICLCVCHLSLSGFLSMYIKRSRLLI
jgi:hypothetical protein